MVRTGSLVLAFFGILATTAQGQGGNAARAAHSYHESPDREWGPILSNLESPVIATREDAQRQLALAPIWQLPALAALASQEKNPEIKARVEARLLEINEYATMYCNRGAAFANMVAPMVAIEAYSRALDIDPLRLDAYKIRGLIRQQWNDPEGALSDYSKAVQIGLSRNVLDDAHPAITQLQLAGNANPESPAFFFGRAIGLHLVNDQPGAIADFSKAIELKPDYMHARALRGFARQVSGDVDGALSDFTKTLELDPEQPWVYYSRAWLYYDIQRWKDALQDSRAVLQSAPADVDAHFLAFLVRTRMGEKEPAAAELTHFMASRKSIGVNDWKTQIGDYLTGRLAPEALLKAADHPDRAQRATRQSEAYFFLGTMAHAAARTADATSYFEKCLGVANPLDRHGTAAKVELQQLK